MLDVGKAISSLQARIASYMTLSDTGTDAPSAAPPSAAAVAAAAGGASPPLTHSWLPTEREADDDAVSGQGSDKYSLEASYRCAPPRLSLAPPTLSQKTHSFPTPCQPSHTPSWPTPSLSDVLERVTSRQSLRTDASASSANVSLAPMAQR